jgi:hypothetical protein
VHRTSGVVWFILYRRPAEFRRKGGGSVRKSHPAASFRLPRGGLWPLHRPIDFDTMIATSTRVVTPIPMPIRKNASTLLKSKDLYVFSVITVGLLPASKYADITETYQTKPLLYRFCRFVTKKSISLIDSTVSIHTSETGAGSSRVSVTASSGGMPRAPLGTAQPDRSARGKCRGRGVGDIGTAH